MINFFADANKIKCFKLIKRKWSIVKEIEYVLGIPFNATIALQRKDLTLSDVFGIWIKMKLHLKACLSQKHYRTDLAKHLLAMLNERTDTIFQNPFMTSALFLDPRYRRQILTDPYRLEQAKNTLRSIWRRLIVLRATTPTATTEPNVSATSNNSEHISFEFDEQAELDKYLSGTSKDQPSVVNPSVSSSNHPEAALEVDIDALLDEFDPPIMLSTENVLEFWEAHKHEYETL